jgi:IMP cyclohydrolase
VDLSKVEDPSLIIYEAMLERPGVQIVTNGDQTRTIHDALARGGSFVSALMTREREPDAPNYTPRISAMLDLGGSAPAVQLAILTAGRCDPAATDRAFFCPAPPAAGFGYGLTTYMGDGNPLPSYAGDPLLLPCTGSAAEILAAYWEALDDDNRISLAVKSVGADGATKRLLVQNRHG